MLRMSIMGRLRLYICEKSRRLCFRFDELVIIIVRFGKFGWEGLESILYMICLFLEWGKML